jgi:ATP-dependent RNA helicase DDX10/DBP4
MREGGVSNAVLEPALDDDGYVSPDFDISDHSDDEDEVAPPPRKRSKASKRRQASVEVDEELALRLLRAS